MTHQRVILATNTIDGAPGLPDKLKGLSDATLADIEASIVPCPPEFEGVGYLPIQSADTMPANKIATGRHVEWVGSGPKWVHDLEDVPLADRKLEMRALVNALRDEKVEAGMTYGGVVYQTRSSDRENMAGAATAALAAMVNGATVGDYRWHGGSTDFEWIAADNSTHKLDAQGMFDLAKAALDHKSALIFAGKTIKDTIEEAADHAALDAIDITTGWPT